MLQRFVALFNVRGNQDFRGLFTDPPISFATEYPGIPMPESQFSPMLLAAKWICHDLYCEDMPELAVSLLENGLDTPSVRRLAGETHVTCSADIEDLIGKMYRELGVPYPISERQAKTILSRQIAREVIAGFRNPWAAASNLEIALWGRETSGDPDLSEIGNILDSLDWAAANRGLIPQLTADLLKAFARLAVRPAPQMRMASLGCLEGKGWIADDFDAPLPADIQAQFEDAIEPQC